jgi:hypothetical protein
MRSQHYESSGTTGNTFKTCGTSFTLNRELDERPGWSYPRPKSGEIRSYSCRRLSFWNRGFDREVAILVVADLEGWGDATQVSYAYAGTVTERLFGGMATYGECFTSFRHVLQSYFAALRPFHASHQCPGWFGTIRSGRSSAAFAPLGRQRYRMGGVGSSALATPTLATV